MFHVMFSKGSGLLHGPKLQLNINIAAVHVHILVDIFMYLYGKQMNIGYLLSSSVIMFHVMLSTEACLTLFANKILLSLFLTLILSIK
jgi:hypothetical protein